ncbi:hypothetical protein JZ751_002251 [Albula glossodonta]|uniref:Uncharacterized protein n=1 Tax=Albula glossodonta TaxID=121402 RepID=A0A8T2P7J3_9TELE|nr:hypothetical protein JZ751_002251 [Albula glossodonta]
MDNSRRVKSKGKLCAAMRIFEPIELVLFLASRWVIVRMHQLDQRVLGETEEKNTVDSAVRCLSS